MENRLLGIVHALIKENGLSYNHQTLAFNYSLQGHLGLDSISRAELFRRVEEEFKVRLPDQVLKSIETLQDILDGLLNIDKHSITDSHQRSKTIVAETHTDASLAMTLGEVLTLHAKKTPNRSHIYLQKDDGKEEVITYQHLLNEAHKIANHLLQKGLYKSETVGIMLPTDRSFFYSFLGVLLAGGIPVPIYPPTRINQLESYIKKESLILSNASIRYLITFDQAKLLSRLLKSFVPSLKSVLCADTLLEEGNSSMISESANFNDIALIQYTSGSTSHPKGVVLTHQNILENIRAYGEALEITSKDVCVSWLPLYHDLGLIGNWLGSLYFGVPLVTFSPIDFLNRPEKWLWAIHHHRGTISAAPNFAYELCVNKLNPHKLDGLDLSSWRVAVNGAEMINRHTLDRFYEKYAPYGFRKESILPVYGLAENALGLTATPLNRGMHVDIIQRAPFENKQEAIPATNINDKDYLEIVSCGKVLPRHQIRIMSKEGQVLSDRQVGQIQFKGPSNMQGYFNDSKATDAIYHEGWWDTGDLGYIANSEIYITGRKKDIIIKAGRNFIPTDIEQLTAEIPGIRRGCVISFSLKEVKEATEGFAIVAETSESNLKKLEQEINCKIVETLNIAPDKIILVPPRTIPKTSSGKLQRAECKKMYLENKLGKTHSPLWFQFSKLGLKSALVKGMNLLKLIEKFLYTIYMGFWALATLPLVWLLIFFLPEKHSSRLVRLWCRFIGVISCIPIRIRDKENILKHRQQIFVANHTSYIDFAVLLSILPESVCVVGKKSLSKTPIIQSFFKKLGYNTVDKHNAIQALEDIEVIKERLREGKSILIFPEGTFLYVEGLRSFKLGAFKLAVEMQVPICPIAISGTRYVLRENSLLFKWHPIKVTVGASLMPKSQTWKEVIRLKNAAYSTILSNCGEENLDFVVVKHSESQC